MCLFVRHLLELSWEVNCQSLFMLEPLGGGHVQCGTIGFEGQGNLISEIHCWWSLHRQVITVI